MKFGKEEIYLKQSGGIGGRIDSFLGPASREVSAKVEEFNLSSVSSILSSDTYDLKFIIY